MIKILALEMKLESGNEFRGFGKYQKLFDNVRKDCLQSLRDFVQFQVVLIRIVFEGYFNDSETLK